MSEPGTVALAAPTTRLDPTGPTGSVEPVAPLTPGSPRSLRELADRSDSAGPASGAWVPGDPVGRRRFLAVPDFPLESGENLPNLRIAYETWGNLDPNASNAVLVLHALTGDSHVTGEAGPGHPTPGWWSDLVGPGLGIDTDKYFVVAPNVLGGCQGTTGPSSAHPDGQPWGSRFPAISNRDQVAAEHLLLEHLGLTRWALVIGGSFGGMRALEWAIMYPDAVVRLAIVAATARASADQIAWCLPQMLAITGSPAFRGGDYYDDPIGPGAGLGIARRIAHATYRSAAELGARFANDPQSTQPGPDADPRFAVESYLDHQAEKLVERFDANSYLLLTEAMNRHDVGRGRGGLAAALAAVTARTLVVVVSSDRLYPPDEGHFIAAHIPGATAAQIVDSPIGHDGFLVESRLVGQWVRELLSD